MSDKKPNTEAGDSDNLYITSSNPNFNINYPKSRKIDFSKVNELEDVISILKGLEIVVAGQAHPELEKYLTDDT